MLHKLCQTVAVLASASAAFAGPALAAGDNACRVAEAGLSTQLEAYLDEASHCVAQPPEGVTLRNDVEAELVRQINERRAAAGEDPLRLRYGLYNAARLHAVDMAARGYAAHEDPEGRGHLQRARAIDRTALFGAMGGNVAVVKQTDASQVDAKIAADPVNAANIQREEFTHMGVGVAEAGGRLYAVEVFARVDGELRDPMPARVSRLDNVRPDFADNSFAMETVRLENAAGDELGVSINSRLSGVALTGETAYLDVSARGGDTVYTLYGPSVTASRDD